MREENQHNHLKYYPIPQAEDISIREKEDAMGAYLMMFASIGIGLPLPIINLIASIIYYFINRSSSLFVRFHALQSLYSQIPVTLLNACMMFFILANLMSASFIFSNSVIAYIVTVVVINIIYFIVSIMAAVASRKGRFFYFWFFGKLVYHRVFLYREEVQQSKFENKPPM